jgi:glycosyltransferase involved in cell wall biosynthesis
MQYPTEAGQSYLTTELADALVGAGHRVEVLHLDWNAATAFPTHEFVTTSGVRVVRCAARSVPSASAVLRNASKFVLSGRAAARVARTRFDLESFDAAIAWMPATAISPLVSLMRRAGIRNRILFIWDFFPEHYHEIGRIPGGLALRIAHRWEQRLLKQFTAIICTLPANARYLRQRFNLGPRQRVLVTPVWGDTTPVPPVNRAAVRRRYELPADGPIAVFGGQLIEGRGFEQTIGAADRALMIGSDLSYLFVGDGRLAPMIRDRAKRQANILHRPAVTRAEYLELLGACDVGMVATVPGVTSFAIPSKTVDYLRAGLPIIAAVEHGNDFIRILEDYGVGAAVPFGEPEMFHVKAERLAGAGRITERARRCLSEIFDVRHAVATVVDAAGQGQRAGARQVPAPSDRMPRHSPSAEPATRRAR